MQKQIELTHLIGFDWFLYGTFGAAPTFFSKYFSCRLSQSLEEKNIRLFLIQAKLKSKKISQTQILFANIELENTALLRKGTFQ